jgi:hypothetical protein
VQSRKLLPLDDEWGARSALLKGVSDSAPSIAIDSPLRYGGATPAFASLSYLTSMLSAVHVPFPSAQSRVRDFRNSIESPMYAASVQQARRAIHTSNANVCVNKSLAEQPPSAPRDESRLRHHASRLLS